VPILVKLKSCYILWYGFYQTLNKNSKYTLGQKIDLIFIETIELVSIAVFLSKEEKLPYIRKAIQKTDTLKVLLMILWEIKALDNKKYTVLSEPLSEIGKMLGGWHGQLIKQNSPEKSGEK